MLKNLRRGKLFEQSTAHLIEELEMAIKWETTIILLAIYRSEHVVDDTELILKRHFNAINHQVKRICINKEYPNVARVVSQSELPNTIFSITYLDQGGGSDQADAYRTLNLHREYFIENKIRIIVWLTQNELFRLTNYAPDFWAFRHRVFDFLYNRATPKRSVWFNGVSWHEWPLTKGNHLIDQASRYRDQEKYQNSIEYFKKALRDLQQGDEVSRVAKLWNSLGIIYTETGDFIKAQEAFECAIDLDPSSHILWCELGNMYRIKGNKSLATKFLSKSIRLAPENAKGWNDIGIEAKRFINQD